MHRLTAVLLSLGFIMGWALLLPGAALAEDNDIDESQYQPVLVIEQVTGEGAAVGGEFYITLVIKNYSDYTARNVTARVSTPGEDDDIFLRADEVSQEDPDFDKIEAGETRNLTFPVEVTENAREGRSYRTRITVESQNVFFKPAPRATASKNIEVDSASRLPRLTVERVKLDPEGPSYREPFEAAITLGNKGSVPARDVSVSIKGGVDGENNFQVMDVTNRKFMQEIAPGRQPRISFNLRELEDRDGNGITLNFTYSYPGESQEKTESIAVNLPLDKPEAGAPSQLTVGSYRLEEGENPREYNLRMVIQNRGEEDAKNIRLALEGDGFYVLEGSNVDYLDIIGGGEEKKVVYPVGIETGRDGSHLPVRVNLSYEDEDGDDRPEVEETLGISLERLGLTAVSGEPRVLISKYTLSEEEIQGGSTFALNLSVENTFSRPVQNVRVSFEPIRLEDSNGTHTSGGTVFSPVEGSNSFYIEEIPAKSVIQRSIDFYVDPNAAARTFIMPVKLDYEDEDAVSYHVEENVNVPVTQESRLQILSIETPPNAFLGQPLYINAEFVNVGKVDLGNMMVMLEGDFPKEQASYFFGNLEIGQSDFYQGIIHPQEEGLLEGELVFSYIDHQNQEVEVSEPFDVHVEGRPPEMEGPQEMPPEMERPGEARGRGTLYLILGLAAAAVLVIFILRRRAKKKAEEEFLDA